MTLLIADVGGTNTRIGMIRQGRHIAGLERFENDEFNCFENVLDRYSQSQDLDGVTECCIALAGPVTSAQACLTNRDWVFDSKSIADRLTLPTGGQVFLVNDLVALGYALSGLVPGQLSLVRSAAGPDPLNNQALVVGLGTGFNICVVKSELARPVVIEAEMGHASLPSSASALLAHSIGATAAQFPTFEHLFSGRGMSRLYRHYSDGDDQSSSQILAGYDPARRDARAQSVELVAKMLGTVARELVFQHLPYGGIHFAGGVARGLLGSEAKGVFLEAFNTPVPFGEYVAPVPIQVITDDAAALAGAAYFAQLASRT